MRMGKTLEEICEMLLIPEEIRPEIFAFDREFDYKEAENLFPLLCRRETWEEARKALKEKLFHDERGIRILTVMLHCLGTITYEQYQQKGIPDEIFVETQKCFTRFIQEYRDSYGRFGFDRDFWTVRQMGSVLFRIGELEYEFDTHEGEAVLSIHIPSDAVLTPENCDSSLASAEQFFREFYPEKAGLRYFCESWLLSPALKELLKPESNIIRFQNKFDILSWDRESKEYEMWVFQKQGLSPEELPENSSLQRNMKKFILDGGKVGEACGVLKKTVAPSRKALRNGD